MSIRNHPMLVLFALVTVFFVVLGFAVATTPFFSTPLASASCSHSTGGVTCVAYVYKPSHGGGGQLVQLVQTSNSTSVTDCGHVESSYWIITGSNAPVQTFVVYEQQSCLWDH